MHQIIFVGAQDEVMSLELDESPVDGFPCMSSGRLHRDARSQLYSIITGEFLDAAFDLEELFHAMTEDGPNIYRLAPSLQSALADMDEDRIEEAVARWSECEDIEDLALEADELNDFLFQYVHFCQTAASDDDFGVFIYSDD